MNGLQFLLGLINTYGPRIKEAWPHLEHAFEDIQQAIQVMNGGKPIMMDGPGVRLSDEATRFINLATSYGVDPASARKVALIAQEQYIQV